MAATGILYLAAATLLLVVQAVADDGSVPEILKDNGLPEGLLPATVESYSLSENGKFKVWLTSACTAKISSEEVYYKKSITGELSYGKIKNLAGIQAHEFFWVSVTGIEIDKNNPKVIWFKVGFISKSINVAFFQDPPTCNSLSDEEEENKDAMTFSAWLSQALSASLEINMPNTQDNGTTQRTLQ